MTREEKNAYFDRMCNETDCDVCPVHPLHFCENLATISFTDEEVDKSIALLEKHMAEIGKGGQLEFDAVKRPEHYAKTSIECIDAMIETQGKEAVKAYCVCNAFKYIWRHNLKNGDEDIKKAAWYLNKAVELMGEEG